MGGAGARRRAGWAALGWQALDWLSGGCGSSLHHALPPAPMLRLPYPSVPAGELPTLELGPAMFAILIVGSLMKLGLWWLCVSLKDRYSSASWW